jgi:carboxymethylenebutenolidase
MITAARPFASLSRILVPILVMGFALTTAACGGGAGDGKPAAPPAAGERPDASMSRDNVDAMAREHADDEAVPSGAAGTASGGVVSEELAYADVGGSLVRGYFAAPGDMVEPVPAVIMIHEWWGLNDNIRAMADRLAAAGYMVLAVDLYGGRTADKPSDARELMMELLENQDRAEENLRQAHAFLQEVGAPGVASVGWCLGGHWSLRTALLFPRELDAAVIYYGQVILDEEALAPLEVPLLGLFAAEDTGIRLESVQAFRATMEELDKDLALKIYPDVGHAFANPTGNNFDAEAAEDAWAMTLDFLADHLPASPASGD